MLIILSVAYLFVDSWNTYNLFSDKTRGVYYSELGGYLDRFGEDVREAAEFLNGKKVFSTYSSALEVVTDQFHPTKYDYIIHAMGDEARKEYLEIFKEGEFDYVATQNGDFNFWEPWIRSANWYFYQELFDNYHPIYENTYEVFWERNEEGKTNKKKMNADVEIRKVSESRVIIYVRTDENINGFANLDIEYKTEKTNPLVIYTSLGCYDIFSNMYKSKEDTTNYNQFALRGSDEIRKETIPLFMKDGEGAIIIRANPEEDAKLMIGEIKCDSYYNIEY